MFRFLRPPVALPAGFFFRARAIFTNPPDDIVVHVVNNNNQFTSVGFCFSIAFRGFRTISAHRLYICVCVCFPRLIDRRAHHRSVTRYCLRRRPSRFNSRNYEKSNNTAARAHLIIIIISYGRAENQIGTDRIPDGEVYANSCRVISRTFVLRVPVRTVRRTDVYGFRTELFVSISPSCSTTTRPVRSTETRPVFATDKSGYWRARPFCTRSLLFVKL